MAFIGWTGRGMPKRRPVRMLARPEKRRVVGSEMLVVAVRAMRRGRRVLGGLGLAGGGNSSDLVSRKACLTLSRGLERHR